MLAVVMVVSIGPFAGASHATSNGRIKPEGRLCLDRLPATAMACFFPLLRRGSIPRGTKNPSAAVLRWRFGPEGCGPIAPRAKDRHRGCDGRGPTTEEHHYGYH